mgnify:CR=1 FL=1
MSHEEIYERYQSEEITQSELADEYGLAQSTVSSIIRRLDRTKETGEEDDLFDTSSFVEDDETETHDEDDYWCSECEAKVEYMEPEWPNCGTAFNWDAV